MTDTDESPTEATTEPTRSDTSSSTGTGARSKGPIRPRRSGRWQGGAAVVFLALSVVIAVFAPLVAGTDPNAQDLTVVLRPPSAAHWLGTDDLGRDLWARLVYGTRISLLASVVAVGVAIVVGVPMGVVAGYLGGWVDAVLMRMVDTLLSFPALVLAVGVASALGPGLVNSMVAVGVVFSPTLARLARGQVLATKERLFVSAAVTYGASNWRVIRRHVLPNILQPLIVQMALLMGTALLAEAALSFLGLGVAPPEASWGSMLQESFQFVAQAPTAIYFPGLAIALTVLAFNAIGEALRDLMDPARAGPARRTTRRLPWRS